ncbi:hypothetical protein Tco_1393856 [Tanacetum coccineum]
MEVLIKTLINALSDKTILDSHCFVHELKKEMNDDLEYVKSLEKEVDELESEKADFSNIYDLLLEECVSKDVTCSYLHSLSDLNANTELQCLYLHKVKECECLAQKLSKQTESVNKEVYNNLLKSFSKLEKHSILLKLAFTTIANHDECVLEYLSRLNPRASAQNKDAKSHKTTKRYMPIEKSSASKKPERQIPTGHRNQCQNGFTKDEIFMEMTFEQRSSSLGHQSDQASVFMEMMSVHISSGLVLHQMTSDHNRSELGIQDHSNEQTSSKLVPKVVPLAVKTATSRQELELLFHHHIAMLRTTGK